MESAHAGPEIYWMRKEFRNVDKGTVSKCDNSPDHAHAGADDPILLLPHNDRITWT